MNPLSNYQLAAIAQRLLLENGGFTLDEFGNSITGDLWAVSVEGKKQRYDYLPSLQLIENYLEHNPIREGTWGFSGWQDDSGIYYLVGKKKVLYLKEVTPGEAFRHLSDFRQRG